MKMTAISSIGVFIPFLFINIDYRLQAVLPGAQVNQLCNLLRWFDYIQHTVGAAAGDILPQVPLPLPPYKAPPPPAVSLAAKVRVC
jgi:hypothetical protein